MAKLSRIYVAHFHSDRKHSFATEKIVARNYDAALDVAEDWAASKYPGRVKDIRIEKAKGEVLIGDDQSIGQERSQDQEG